MYYSQILISGTALSQRVPIRGRFPVRSDSFHWQNVHIWRDYPVSGTLACVVHLSLTEVRLKSIFRVLVFQARQADRISQSILESLNKDKDIQQASRCRRSVRVIKITPPPPSQTKVSSGGLRTGSSTRAGIHGWEIRSWL
jgi:hypothetical protein